MVRPDGLIGSTNKRSSALLGMANVLGSVVTSIVFAFFLQVSATGVSFLRLRGIACVISFGGSFFLFLLDEHRQQVFPFCVSEE
jgi:hypothetical protein